MVDAVGELLGGAKKIAMQYSPKCAIPYVAMVDAGTMELVRGLGVEIGDVGESDSVFRSAMDAGAARKSPGSGRRIDRIRRESFERIGAKQRAGERVTEWDIKQFILDRYKEDGIFIDHGPDVAVNANASNPHYDPTTGCVLGDQAAATWC